MMMWKSVPPENYCWEPKELRALKRRLANLTCNCKTQNDLKALVQNRNHKEVQVSKPVPCYDQDIQVSPSLSVFNDIDNIVSGSNTVRSIEPYCPTCFAVHELLRGGIIKYLKDEETEACIDKATCDKSTDKTVKCLEKTTSQTCIKPALKNDSNVSGSPTNSDTSCEIPNVINSVPRNYKKKKLDREVTFLLNYQEPVATGKEPLEYSITAEYEYDPNDSNRLKCTCADDIINAIRPPFSEHWL